MISGRAVATASASAPASNISTTTGAIPSPRNVATLSGERVVPATSCPASRSRTASRLPTTPVAPARKILIRHEPLRRVLQPLQRLEDLCLARHRRLALFFFFLDDFFRRIGDEFFVAELGVDALDVGVGLGDFLV